SWKRRNRMEPIKASEKQSLKQRVIEGMKQYIIDSELTSGDKLPTERAFTELFDVSRSVIREALSYLENIGILRIRQGQGAIINESNIEKLMDSFFFLWQINHKNIREVLGLRVIFECSAIDEIIVQNNHQAIKKLKRTIETMEQSNDPEIWRQSDVDFHQQLLQSTQNELFIQMTNMITNYFFQVQHIELSAEETKQTMKEHYLIIEAIEANDGLRAKEILTKHINQAKV